MCYAYVTTIVVVLCSRFSVSTTTLGTLPGSRQGKERPFRANQERSRLRNQEIRLTASGEISYGARTGCPTRLIPFLDGRPPHRLHGRYSLLAGVMPGRSSSGRGMRTPGRRSAAAPTPASPPAARPPDALSSGPGLRRAH